MNVFGNYLKEDSAVEIIRTSHGVTVGAWDDNNGGLGRLRKLSHCKGAMHRALQAVLRLL